MSPSPSASRKKASFRPSSLWGDNIPSLRELEEHAKKTGRVPLAGPKKKYRPPPVGELSRSEKKLSRTIKRHNIVPENTKLPKPALKLAKDGEERKPVLKFKTWFDMGLAGWAVDQTKLSEEDQKEYNRGLRQNQFKNLQKRLVKE
jgi:hypothetical protein